MEKKTDMVTSVFVRRVPADAAADYERWLERIASKASRFEGNLGATVIRPEAVGGRYIAITSFATVEGLESWLDSPERDECLADLNRIPVTTEQTEHLSGLERWFSVRAMDTPPAKYKIATLLVIGLFPTVLLLEFATAPIERWLPWPVSTLVSLIASVCLMVWIVMPLLIHSAHRWLHIQRDA
jgi:hypothetical protein